MRFMFMVRSTSNTPPTPALMEAMHRMSSREIKAGRMLDDGGLLPLSAGARVDIAEGKLRVLDGPEERREQVGRRAAEA